AEDAMIQLADAEAERDAILKALMALSLISRQILYYSFCVPDSFSNYRISREVGYSERSIQRMKSEALIEFAEAYRHGEKIAYK
ncbi:ArpU family phage packaging/lysis transcriptional regulator, partial [Enterococcus hirae]